jgi:poly(3-hydroxybutyrate) depolymerase
MHASWSRLGALLIALLGSSLLGAATARAQQTSATGTSCAQDGMPCLYWAPEGADPTAKLPLVLYLHGAGQAGTDGKKHVDDWADLLRPYLAAANRKAYPAYVVAPQCPGVWVDWPWAKGSYDVNAVPESASLKKVLAIVEALRAKHPIDPDRIYVTGYSMGGEGTWDLIARHAELFAAAVPVFGVGPPNAAPRLRNLAIWSFHNADDGAVPVSSDRELFRAIAAAGGRPLYSESRTGGHFGFSAPNSPDVMAWMFKQRRSTPVQPSPQLAFTPPGGAHAAAPLVTLSSSLARVELRYATNGGLPSATTGQLYAGPFPLPTSAILTATATSGTHTVHHAAPFVVGNTPLPDGAVLTPPADAGAPGDARQADARAGGGGVGGAGGSGGAGGASGAAGSGGAGVAGGTGGVGALRLADAGPSATGPGPATVGGAGSGAASGGAGGAGAPTGTPGAGDGVRGDGEAVPGGCACTIGRPSDGPDRQPGRRSGALVLAFALAASISRARRRRAGQGRRSPNAP